MTVTHDMRLAVVQSFTRMRLDKTQNFLFNRGGKKPLRSVAQNLCQGIAKRTCLNKWRNYRIRHSGPFLLWNLSMPE